MLFYLCTKSGKIVTEKGDGLIIRHGRVNTYSFLPGTLTLHRITTVQHIPYTLKFSRGQYFADWLKKLKNKIFAGV